MTEVSTRRLVTSALRVKQGNDEPAACAMNGASKRWEPLHWLKPQV